MHSLEAFSHVQALCLGDVMLDRFISGSVKRISPESPVPVLSVDANTTVPGATANVARNIAAQGGRCTLISVVGQDVVADELTRCLASIHGVDTHWVREPGRPTTEKIRFVAHGQHMLRTDIEMTAPISSASEQQVLELVKQKIASHQVLVLSDYAKGVLTDKVVQGAISLAQAQGVPVIVDPKSKIFQRYAGATVVTPNAKEVFDACGIDPTDDDDKAIAAGELLRMDARIGAVLVTRAHRGMTLVGPDGHAHIRASAREVFDVVGAGDTVVATLALSLGAGDPLHEAATLANLAAGIVVGKRGTATVSHAELLAELQRIGQGGLSWLEEKVMDLESAAQLINEWRQDGQKVGFTNGCFDILHVGHLSILGYAKAQCNRLVVGVNSDASVKRLKGPERPINTEDDRALLLAGLAAVDAVVIFDDDTPLQLIQRLVPDVLIKGADYTIDKIVGADVVMAHGGRVVTCPLVPGRSTTRIVDTLKHGHKS